MRNYFHYHNVAAPTNRNTHCIKVTIIIVIRRQLSQHPRVYSISYDFCALPFMCHCLSSLSYSLSTQKKKLLHKPCAQCFMGKLTHNDDNETRSLTNNLHSLSWDTCLPVIILNYKCLIELGWENTDLCNQRTTDWLTQPPPKSKPLLGILAVGWEVCRGASESTECPTARSDPPASARDGREVSARR